MEFHESEPASHLARCCALATCGQDGSGEASGGVGGACVVSHATAEPGALWAGRLFRGRDSVASQQCAGEGGRREDHPSARPPAAGTLPCELRDVGRFCPDRRLCRTKDSAGLPMWRGMITGWRFTAETTLTDRTDAGRSKCRNRRQQHGGTGSAGECVGEFRGSGFGPARRVCKQESKRRKAEDASGEIRSEIRLVGVGRWGYGQSVVGNWRISGASGRKYLGLCPCLRRCCPVSCDQTPKGGARACQSVPEVLASYVRALFSRPCRFPTSCE